MRSLRRTLAIALLGASCGSAGALGQLQASPTCGASDLACTIGGIDAPLAVGARLPIDLDLRLVGSGAPATKLVSGEPTVLEAAGAELRGAGPGVAALLVALADEPVVLDFVHVWVMEPDRADLAMLGEDGSDLGEILGVLQLLPGDELRVSEQLRAGLQPLLGHGDSEWSLVNVDGEAVSLLADGAPWRRRLVARAPGRATVTLRTLGLETRLELEVLP